MHVRRYCRWHDITQTPADYRAFVPAPKDARLRDTGSTKTPAKRGPFDRWLLRQSAEGLRARLIRAAGNDPKWPLDGDAEAAAARLRECAADGDLFAVLEEAELDRVSY